MKRRRRRTTNRSRACFGGPELPDRVWSTSLNERYGVESDLPAEAYEVQRRGSTAKEAIVVDGSAISQFYVSKAGFYNLHWEIGAHIYGAKYYWEDKSVSESPIRIFGTEPADLPLKIYIGADTLQPRIILTLLVDGKRTMSIKKVWLEKLEQTPPSVQNFSCGTISRPVDEYQQQETFREYIPADRSNPRKVTLKIHNRTPYTFAWSSYYCYEHKCSQLSELASQQVSTIELTHYINSMGAFGISTWKSTVDNTAVDLTIEWGYSRSKRNPQGLSCTIRTTGRHNAFNVYFRSSESSHSTDADKPNFDADIFICLPVPGPTP